jgi:hypothetical protein
VEIEENALTAANYWPAIAGHIRLRYKRGGASSRKMLLRRRVSALMHSGDYFSAIAALQAGCRERLRRGTFPGIPASILGESQGFRRAP